jgi:alanyl-tRNA synthetase
VKGGEKGLVGLILDRSNFYAEGGGQIADVGEMQLAGSKEEDEGIAVVDTQRYAGYVLHSCRVPATAGEISVGAEVDLFVDLIAREPTMSNHTSTHVLNHALRRVLGDGVEQKGSLVDFDRTRFDFSHRAPVTDEELVRIEDLVRSTIDRDLPVHVRVVPLTAAKAVNALRTVPGEKYPDPVRLVSVGRSIDELLAHPTDPINLEFSVEFCGGTHLQRSSEARLFVITSETGVSQGVRRIVAVTGAGAERVLNNSKTARQMILDAGKMPETSGKFETAVGACTQYVSQTQLPVRDVVKFRDQIQTLVNRVLALRNKRIADATVMLKALAENKDAPFIVTELDCGSDRNVLGKAVVELRELCPTLPFLLASRDTDTVIVMTQSCKGHAVHAGNWAKDVIAVCGGKGGGSAEAGQGNATNVATLDAALEAARKWVTEKSKK